MQVRQTQPKRSYQDCDDRVTVTLQAVLLCPKTNAHVLPFLHSVHLSHHSNKQIRWSSLVSYKVCYMWERVFDTFCNENTLKGHSVDVQGRECKPAANLARPRNGEWAEDVDILAAEGSCCSICIWKVSAGLFRSTPCQISACLCLAGRLPTSMCATCASFSSVHCEKNRAEYKQRSWRCRAQHKHNSGSLHLVLIL